MKGSRSSSFRKRSSAAALVAAAALAFPAAAVRAEASAEEIRAQVEALASDRFERREAATAALRKIGEPARPALEEASRSPDPEVRFRAIAVLKDLDARGLRPPRTGGGGGAREEGGALQVESVSVQEWPDRVRVAVTTQRGGKREEKVYEAPTREELRKRHPDIYARYLEGGFSRVLDPRDFLVPSPPFRGLDLDEEFERMRRGMLDRRGFGGLKEGVRRPRLGITHEPVPEALALHLKLEGGALLTSVAQGSPAEQAGLKAQDILLRFGDSPVRTVDDLVEAVRGAPAGKPCRVEGIREGKPFSLEVRLPDPEEGEGK